MAGFRTTFFRVIGCSAIFSVLVAVSVFLPFGTAAVGFVGFFAVTLTAGTVAFGLFVGFVATVGGGVSTAAAGVATAALVGLRGAVAGCFFVFVAGTGSRSAGDCWCGCLRGIHVPVSPQ